MKKQSIVWQTAPVIIYVQVKTNLNLLECPRINLLTDVGNDSSVSSCDL